MIYNLHTLSKSNGIIKLCTQNLQQLKPLPDTYTISSASFSNSDLSQYSPTSTNLEISENVIDLSNINFSYPNKDQNILDNFSIKFPKGLKTALVGPNGSGKSTLLKLIMRYINHKSGSYYLNNKSTNIITDKDLRKTIGYVQQQPILFNRTIQENILYSNPSLTVNDLHNKIKMLGLEEFFTKFPKGLDTSVGKQGLSISGGQRQVIQIIRVLIQDPDIILFDEPTAAIDSKHEELIDDLISNLHGKTIIISTHNENILKKMDKVIHLK
jgi:ABC-type bacteriocin/lantibiotic exporter with double-glycine peptidase domain